jgi:hypothetical protein
VQSQPLFLWLQELPIMTIFDFYQVANGIDIRLIKLEERLCLLIFGLSSFGEPILMNFLQQSIQHLKVLLKLLYSLLDNLKVFVASIQLFFQYLLDTLSLKLEL